MKFLIDENVGQTVIDYLKLNGYDILVVKQFLTGREDYLLVERA